LFIEDTFSTIANATQKMNRLLNQLRKQQSEKTNVSKVDLVSVLDQVVNNRTQSKPSPVFESPKTRPVIFADRERLAAVLEHLVQNAQEATAIDGFVHLNLSINNGLAKIAIVDNGCGMSEDFVRGQLFKPFHTTKGNAGMGIGVYEAREFVRSLGGSVTVNSRLGEGTTFLVSLPVQDEIVQKNVK